MLANLKEKRLRCLASQLRGFSAAHLANPTTNPSYAEWSKGRADAYETVAIWIEDILEGREHASI